MTPVLRLRQIIILIVYFGMSSGTAAIESKQGVEPTPADNLVHYHYNYMVEDEATGVYMSSWEERRSDLTRGSYSFLEPGGRIRTVDYQVDANNGFKAVMSIFPPGYNWLSSQQYRKSLELYPPQSVNLDVSTRNETSKESPSTKFLTKSENKVGQRRAFGKLKGK